MARRNCAREKVAWDGVVKGLGLRRRGKGASWILQTRIRGRSVKRVIAEGTLPRPEARARAREALAELLSSVEATPERLVTVAQFGARFMADKAAGWSARTIDSNRAAVEAEIIPHLGHKRLCDVTRADVITWRDALTCSPASKNRHMAVLSGMMRHAELLDLRPPGSNPCKGLRRRKSRFTASYLTRDEFAAVGAALRALETRFAEEVALLRFVALTGCRKGEALSLKWDWLDGQRFALPRSKSGPRSIWLGKAALALVKGQARGSGFVFAEGGEPLTEARLDRVWRRLREHAGMPRFRIHDLRHSFASVAIGNGIGMRTLAGLLGHHDLNSTAGYAHLQEDALRASVARVGAHMSGLLAIKDRTPKPYREIRVINGVVADGPARRGPKPKPRPIKVAEGVAKPARTPAQERAFEKARKRAQEARLRKEAERVAQEKARRAQVRRFLRSDIGLPEFCAREGLNPTRFRADVIALRASVGRRAAA